MKQNFNIGAKRGLLDDKHMNAMGTSIWLYLWLIDKQIKDSDLVLFGKPITFEMVQESFNTLSRRTYVRWVACLVDNGYIKTKRTPNGFIISIQKAKKWDNNTPSDVTNVAHRKVKSDVTKMAHQSTKSAGVMRQKWRSDVPNVAEGYAKNGTSNIIATKEETLSIIDFPVGKPSEVDIKVHKEAVSKLCYDIAKEYDLDIMNHTTFKKKIKDMAEKPDRELTINYLTFLLTEYKALKFKFKPEITKDLDIFSKRKQIKTRLEETIEKQQNLVGVVI